MNTAAYFFNIVFYDSAEKAVDHIGPFVNISYKHRGRKSDNDIGCPICGKGVGNSRSTQGFRKIHPGNRTLGHRKGDNEKVNADSIAPA